MGFEPNVPRFKVWDAWPTTLRVYDSVWENEYLKLLTIECYFLRLKECFPSNFPSETSMPHTAMDAIAAEGMRYTSWGFSKNKDMMPVRPNVIRRVGITRHRSEQEYMPQYLILDMRVGSLFPSILITDICFFWYLRRIPDNYIYPNVNVSVWRLHVWLGCSFRLLMSHSSRCRSWTL